MKILNILTAAALGIAAVGASTAANAEPRHNNWNNGHHQKWNGNHKRWDKRHHRVRCHTEWRHHHKVRVCR
ncbi:MULTISPECIES: hypothetical protein [unclassified Sphingomonas]|uniref:hypothetical protein n=1 Tax=unclassified Sphingomonas TaxID=196159 RepID=UPI0006F6B352|nr:MULTISPECIES: hypothetical protein [unclassified Sphingomonas]KQX18132.1 hypothetical protein ASD17_20895 [Sphingomonas sp. Root1294]KQY72687.1 hypothetical protein ASD39_18010 [Sphingomonas sp. Root50]KRB87687.1 hypothetical protein ASE22_23565 [Sphingomonas sp. Root720]